MTATERVGTYGSGPLPRMPCSRRQAIELRLRGDLLHALTMLTELAGCSRAVYRSVTGGDQRPASPAMGPNTFGSPVDLDQII